MSQAFTLTCLTLVTPLHSKQILIQCGTSREWFCQPTILHAKVTCDTKCIQSSNLCPNQGINKCKAYTGRAVTILMLHLLGRQPNVSIACDKRLHRYLIYIKQNQRSNNFSLSLRLQNLFRSTAYPPVSQYQYNIKQLRKIIRGS